MEEAVIEQSQEAAPVEQQATEQGGGQEQGSGVTLEQLAQNLTDMRREFGSLRQSQSAVDRVPKMVEEHLTKWQKAQQLNQLPQEERERQQALEQQESALRAFTRKEAAEAFKEAAKDYLPVIESWQKRERDQAFMSELRELAGGEEVSEEQFKELDDAGKSVFQSVIKDLDSGNELKVEAAIRFMERAKTSGPEFVLFHAQRELAKKQKENADGVVQTRVQAGKQAAQSPKGRNAGTSNGPRKRLDKMSEQEREAHIQAVGNEQYGKDLEADMKAAGVK